MTYNLFEGFCFCFVCTLGIATGFLVFVGVMSLIEYVQEEIDLARRKKKGIRSNKE